MQGVILAKVVSLSAIAWSSCLPVQLRSDMLTACCSTITQALDQALRARSFKGLAGPTAYQV